MTSERLQSCSHGPRPTCRAGNGWESRPKSADVFRTNHAAYFAAPVDVLVTDRFVRAFPGGTGNVKPAGNYAPALPADADAQRAGCQTVLWLDGQERRYIEECGVMNVFFVLDDTVVTPSLEGTILPGVTRDSGVLAYVVAQRTREIGIRIALGSTARDIFHLVFKEGLTLVTGGLTLGLVGALTLGQALEGQVFGVRPTDPLVVGTVALSTGIIALLACVSPAHRATRVDPVNVLSQQ